MPKKKYIVSLTVSERKFLEQLTKKGKIAAYKMNHARILLQADINQKEGGWTDRQISESLNIGHATIEKTSCVRSGKGEKGKGTRSIFHTFSL